jgi:predicted glycoside hydrolase/deacetylase ChbG (UPF0249 family)
MKSVIINADDFGLSPGTNRGIVDAFREGVLTSTTLLANMDHFADAVALAHDNPELPVGVHLCLVWGHPVSAPGSIPSLIVGEGAFPGKLSTLARRAATGRLSAEEVATEFRAQVTKVLEAGITPTHLDTHKHTHCLAPVMEGLLTVATEFAIGKVRLPVEHDPAPGPPPVAAISLKSRAKRDLLRLLFRNSRELLERRGVVTTDRFFGVGHQDRLDAGVLSALLSRAGEGSTEIMCHPGRADGEAPGPSRIPTARRQAEVEALLADGPRKAALAAGIRLISYRDL